MRHLLLAAVAVLSAAAGPAFGQQGTYQPFTQPSGAEVPAFVMLCATGDGRLATPCGALASPFYVMTMPFTRLQSAPIRLKDIGPTPKSFQINRPAGAIYRNNLRNTGGDLLCKSLMQISVVPLDYR